MNKYSPINFMFVNTFQKKEIKRKIVEKNLMTSTNKVHKMRY